MPTKKANIKIVFISASGSLLANPYDAFNKSLFLIWLQNKCTARATKFGGWGNPQREEESSP